MGEMAGEAGHGVAGGDDDVLVPGKPSSYGLSSASPSDSFRSSLASLVDMESCDCDAMYRLVQSEYEEIPSFRWIATPLRWWTTRDRSDLRKMVHFDDHPAFTPEDLMSAKAEFLGKGSLGTVYKATLEDGHQVAVRRLTRAKLAKEIDAEVNLLGKIRHPNLMPLRAYYFEAEGEKLLVFDYMPNGSLSAFLHARRPDDAPIDWPTRVKIAVGVARGLHCLHAQKNMVHGNLTSANILLDDHTNAKVADYGFSRLLATTADSSSLIAAVGGLGYRAPELSQLGKANTKTDVYSLGVILLELLTGYPAAVAMGLARWVAFNMEGNWTDEVLDPELRRKNATTHFALKLALRCVDPSPNARPEVLQVLHQLESITPDGHVSRQDKPVFSR